MQTTVLQFTEPMRQKGVGITSGVAYDTAWAARIVDQSNNPVFPECVRWLLENRHSDGSWGSQVRNYHDRLLSTLSAIMALKELDERRFNGYIRRGEAYIWENIEKLSLDNYRLIGSELLFPSLMEQAELLGLDLPFHVKIYQREYHAKLEKIDESLRYSPFTTLSFSLEFLGENVDRNHLSNVQLPNGSVANSPAATAFFLKHRKDGKALMYLKEILSLTGDGSMMTVYPIDVFENCWTVYNLMLAGLYFEKYTEICDFLLRHLGRSGVGWSAEYSVPDADDTAVACKVLYDLHYRVDFRVLEPFDTGEYFVGYNFELDPAVSANIHVLDFVRSCPEFPDREEVIERLVRFLKREMHPPGFWIDKWHMSPYYPTSHAVFALCDVEPGLAEKAISWILENQNKNGMWGDGDGTLEETAYALQTLMFYHRNVERIDLRTVPKALSALGLREFTTLSANLGDMWMAKVLYNPTRVVCSTIASAQFMTGVGNLHTGNPSCTLGAMIEHSLHKNGMKEGSEQIFKLLYEEKSQISRDELRQSTNKVQDR